MLEKGKPRLGLLGIMHGLYDEKQPEISQKQEKFARDIAARLKDKVDIDFPGAAKTKAVIDKYVEEFNEKGLDGIMIMNLLYSPGLRLVKALQKNRLPLIVANIQPVPAVTKGWNWGDLTTNQGIHGVQDTANTILRMGLKFSVVTEDWKSDNFKSFVSDWASAAQTARALQGMRIAIMGRLPGMGDIVGDDAAFFRKIGPEVNYESIGDVFRYMEVVTDKEVEAQMKEDGKNFKIDPNILKESHRYASRLQLGFEKLLVEKGYDGFSAHFDVFREDGRFKQIPILGASNLLAKGYGYAAEGDTNTVSMTGAGHVLIGDPHFTEMYSLDFEKDSALMSHMGEGNWKIARKDRPVKLIDRELEIGGLENPPTPVFSAEPGPATMISLASIVGDQFRLVISGGEVLDTEVLEDVPMPYFHFRPATGVRQCMDGWLQNGGTHHQILFLGDHVRKCTMLSQLLGIEHVVV